MKVAIVVLDDVPALDVAGVLDVFAEANTILPSRDRYQVVLVGEHAGSVVCSNAMQLSVPWAYSHYHAAVDVLVVMGGSRVSHVGPNDALIAWLRSRALEARRVGSVCDGALLLGQAGLLDGKEVTSRWPDASPLVKACPRARVRPDKTLIRDGALTSSSGANAGLNLGLSLIADDWGQGVAAQLERRFGTGDRSHDDGHEHDVDVLALATESAAIGQIRRYIHDHLTDVMSIEQLASAVSMSRRTLSRMFAKCLRMTPSYFVEQVRVGAAKRLLKDSVVPLKTVAFQCGFHNATHMRMVFLRHTNATPKQHRQGVDPAETTRPQSAIARPYSPSGEIRRGPAATERVNRIDVRIQLDGERRSQSPVRTRRAQQVAEY